MAALSPPVHLLVVRNGCVLALLMAAVSFLRIPDGLFLALGALIVLESDLGRGVLAGRERIQGSFCGLLAVVIAAGALASVPVPLAVFVGLTLVRLFSYAAGLRSGFIVGGQVVAGSLLHHGLDWWPYAIGRTLTTVLGVLLGILVSRHIYSQRSLVLWQGACRRWLLDLAQALEQAVQPPPSEAPYLQLRERRDGLRRQLPQLAAELSVVHLSGEDPLDHAQDLLLEAGTVLSCARDLSLSLREGLGDAGPTTPAWGALVRQGSLHLRAVAEGRDLQASRQHLRLLLEGLQQEMRRHPPEGDTELLRSSRQLMLADALLRLRALPQGVGRRAPAAGPA